MDAETTLVIILSCTLAIFLILSIVAVTFILRMINKVNKILNTVETTVEHVSAKAENMSDLLERTVTPVATGRLFASIAKHLVNLRKK